ncbi:hypothetical protein IFJ82_14205 [Novacetimonas hansenii]|uniref:Antitoxin Xre/MbcA/ParS-like toxin-binding domain-containing protein n=3 Tax=Acetobacteraceae TaxID=433 RepID=A0ABQ0SEH4_NOVHA|nr:MULTISPECIES: hypothetical protein [Acetobacteraceae]EFG84736.1 hypothetical protein GXY_06540 [Novacetimonas hansenii ATCC 23769]QHC34304.1 hypothetical protein FMA36_01165 [Komagataeibacter xylinus]QOF94968.1 hypothetical protein IFJ82_14205 [Novacetimonas hansenii]GAN83531.1 hypothetical protein Gaha_0087_025 [Novacetimonas hansenii JCM 7643]GBQ60944.1 hypothetical protein AA0243_2497 [Novacetimonas hansenii NRIC 0243]
MPTTPVSETRARVAGSHTRTRLLGVGSIVMVPAGLELAARKTAPGRVSAKPQVLEYEVRPQAGRSPSRETATDAYAVGPRGLALLRGKQIRDDDLRRAGGAYTLDQVRELLRVTRQAIEKKVREQAILAVPGPSGERRYPVAQFTGDGVMSGLKPVLAALPSESAWFRLNFLVTPLAQLDGQTPIEALGAGKTEAVVKAAQSIGVQGG